MGACHSINRVNYKYVSRVAGQERGIDPANGFGNALWGKCKFGKLPGASAQRLIRRDIECKRGADRARQLAYIAGPHQPAGAQIIPHARRAQNVFRQHADRGGNHRPANRLRLRGFTAGQRRLQRRHRHDIGGGERGRHVGAGTDQAE